MVELVLFLLTICIFCFVPARFRVYYRKVGRDDQLFYEMSFLGGWLKRRKEISLIQPTAQGTRKIVKKSGRWFLFHRSDVEEVISPFQDNTQDIREFLDRYRHFGLGMTLLTYFLPAKYYHWLLVVEDLEQKGKFEKFIWRTRFGTGEAASTAILCGAFWGFKAVLLGYLGKRSVFNNPPEIQIIPDYQTAKLDMLFDCIFKVNLGYIIIAAFIARQRHRLKGGIGFERASN